MVLQGREYSQKKKRSRGFSEGQVLVTNFTGKLDPIPQVTELTGTRSSLVKPPERCSTMNRSSLSRRRKTAFTFTAKTWSKTSSLCSANKRLGPDVRFHDIHSSPKSEDSALMSIYRIFDRRSTPCAVSDPNPAKPPPSTSRNFGIMCRAFGANAKQHLRSSSFSPSAFEWCAKCNA